jgi:hypothetical protein
MRSQASLVQLHRQLREQGFKAALPKVAEVWQDYAIKRASEVTSFDVALMRHRQTP